MSDFRGYLDRKPVEILRLQSDTGPRRVVILLDVSASMLSKEIDQWSLSLQVVGDAVLNLPPEIHLAFVTFDEKIEDAIAFDQGRPAIANRIIELKRGAEAIPSNTRRTALLDSLERVLTLVGPLQPGDVVYAITDGGDNLSKTSADEVAAAFLTARVRLFAFLLVYRSALGYSYGLRGPTSFRELVESTGGGLVSMSAGGGIGRRTFHLNEKEKRGMAIVLRNVYDEMKQFSWMEVRLPAAVKRASEWSLRLQQSSETALKVDSLLYPHKLLPCRLSETK